MPQRLRGSLEDLKGFFAAGKEKLSGTAKKAGVRLLQILEQFRRN